MLPPDQLLQEAYRTSQDDSMEMFYPTMLVLHSFLAETPDYQERIRLLQDICKNHVMYLKEFNLPEATVASIYLECESLIHYNEILAKLMTSTQNQIIVKDNIANVPLPRLEQYIYLLALKELEVPYFIAFTEGYAYYLRHPEKKKRADLSMAILQVKNFIGRIWSENIIEFSKALYCGESMRLHETNQIGDNDLVGLHSFDVAFRNKCFDEYIRMRVSEIFNDLQADNDRLYPPTELDCLLNLLDTERVVVERELGFEQFKGSQAYHDQWYDGRPDVLKTAGYFLQYLADKIKRMQPKEVSQGDTYNYFSGAVHDDHSKHVNISTDGSSNT